MSLFWTPGAKDMRVGWSKYLHSERSLRYGEMQWPAIHAQYKRRSFEQRRQLSDRQIGQKRDGNGNGLRDVL